MKKILIADDEEDLISLYKGIIEKRFPEYEILSADNGKKAFELAKQNLQELELILTDYNMPEMNGKEFVRKSRELGYRRRIIIITANPFFENKSTTELSNSLGIDDYLTKPFNLTTLVEKIKLNLR
jgi:response regulator RpfG family c-di-GMP phosphodiesterase